jgi:hypothetical protein
MVFTWLYSGYASGHELSEVRDKMDKAGAPPQYIQVNYVNVLFQGLCWPTYWGVNLGTWKYKRSLLKPEPKGEPVKASYGPPPAPTKPDRLN